MIDIFKANETDIKDHPNCHFTIININDKTTNIKTRKLIKNQIKYTFSLHFIRCIRWCKTFAYFVLIK